MKRSHVGSGLFSILAVQAVLATTIGCGNNHPQTQNLISDKNYVRSDDPNLIQTIGDKDQAYKILGSNAISSGYSEGRITPFTTRNAHRVLNKRKRQAPTTAEVEIPSIDIMDGANMTRPVPNNSLAIGISIDALYKPVFFGSVITHVSDPESQELGDLKLTNLPTLATFPVLNKKKENEYSVVFVFCKNYDCSQLPEKPEGLFEIPIVGVLEKEKILVLDFSSLGDVLNPEPIFGKHPALRSYKSKSSRVSMVDFSNSTLVFDVETLFAKKSPSEIDPDFDLNPESDIDIRLGKNLDQARPTGKRFKKSSDLESSGPGETLLTNRWYLQSPTIYNPSFTVRQPTPGIGFFTTSLFEPAEVNSDLGNSRPAAITRWDFDNRDANEGIHYFVKNVPLQYQPAFAAAFEQWNRKMQPITGKKVFSYEFVSESDPRNSLLTAGDVRYNIVEWDLVNKADYGGLGPHISHPITGEVSQGTVLIQGPSIVSTYTKWFDASQKSAELRARGLITDSEVVLRDAHREIESELETASTRKFQVRVGPLSMMIPSQMPSLHDPYYFRSPLEPVPDGVSFESYMNGYFEEVLAHELGHNLGLRHNFRGNLGAADGDPQFGEVSRSIMEYLGRSYRYLNQIGEYDLMAISYGYAGVTPQHTDWFCTDEDAANLRDPNRSAECSKDDATSDPFSYFRDRLTRSLDLLVARGTSATPIWTISDLKGDFITSLVGMGSYAFTAKDTSVGWTNFFRDPSRPTTAAGIREYVLNELKTALCNPALTAESSNKLTRQGQFRTMNSLAQVREAAAQLLKPVFDESRLSCTPPNLVEMSRL